MSVSSWLSILALAGTSAIAVVSLIKESQERREKGEDRPRRWHWHVRLTLTAVGFVAGAILIYLSALSSKANETRHNQERDSDKQQIAGLNQAIETQIRNNETQYLRHQKELGSLHDQVADLKKDIATQDLRKKMEALQARLDKSLAPRPLAKLEAGFWESGIQNDLPTEIYAPLDGNVVSFDFTVANNSDVSAKDVLLWIRICADCKYHREPQGSQNVPGAVPIEREYRGIYLPPGVRWQKLTVEVEVPPSPINQIVIGTRYRCEDCVIEDYQLMYIRLGRLPVPKFGQPSPVKKKKTKKP